MIPLVPQTGLEPAHRCLLNSCVYLVFCATGVLFGSSGKSRTYTGHRMKVAHYRYATLPYRNTLVSLRTALPAVVAALCSSNVFLYGRSTGTRTLIDRLKADYSSLWIILRCSTLSLRLRAFVLLRCEPAFRLFASTANMLRGFIFFSFVIRLYMANYHI